MRTGVPTCRPDELVADVAPRLWDEWPYCVVTNEHGVVQGVLAPAAGATRRVEDAMLLGPRTVRPSARRDAIARRLHDQDLPHFLVARSDGVLLGVVLRADLPSSG